MTTREARRLAETWLHQELAHYPEAVGTIIAGSARTRAPEAPHPAGSDIDLFTFVEATVPPDIFEPRHRFAPRKLAYRGVVLEPSFHEVHQLDDPFTVAGHLHLGPLFAEPCILFDPTGRLLDVANQVAADFHRRDLVHQRLEQALAAADPGAPYGGVPDAPGISDPCWHNVAHAFAIMRCAVPILAANLTPPTTRRSLVVAREILRGIGREDIANELLRLLGSLSLDRSEVEALADEAEQIYDLAVTVRRTAVPLDWNVSPDARTLERAAIREMIAAGDHREAMMQLLLVRTIAQGLIENDGDETARARSRPGFQCLLAALGIPDDAALQTRGREVYAFLPPLRVCCEHLLAGVSCRRPR